MIPEYTVRYHDSSSGTSGVCTCPTCGQIIPHSFSSVVVDDVPIILIIDRNDSYAPFCGHWPHHLHEKRIKQRSKPVHQFVKLPVVHRKCFMQLKTFKNLRFHAKTT